MVLCVTGYRRCVASLSSVPSVTWLMPVEFLILLHCWHFKCCFYIFETFYSWQLWLARLGFSLILGFTVSDEKLGGGWEAN